MLSKLFFDILGYILRRSSPNMKQPTFTDEQIIEAGMQLLAESKRVTPFGIRKIIGGGNPARIKTVWENSQHEAIEGQVVREQVDLPTEFEDSLNTTKESLDELAKRMYSRAQEISESRVRESISAARKAKEVAEAEVFEAMDTVTELDDENNKLKEKQETSRQALQKIGAENSRLEEHIRILTTKAEKDALVLKEEKFKNADLQKKVTTLEVQNKVADKQLKEANHNFTNLEKELSSTQKVTQKLEVTLTTTQNENSNLQNKNNDLSLQINEARKELKTLRASIKDLQNSNQKTETNLAIALSKLEEANNRFKETDSKLKQSRKGEETAKTEASELRGKLAVLESQNKKIKKET